MSAVRYQRASIPPAVNLVLAFLAARRAAVAAARPLIGWTFFASGQRPATLAHAPNRHMRLLSAHSNRTSRASEPGEYLLGMRQKAAGLQRESLVGTRRPPILRLPATGHRPHIRKCLFLRSFASSLRAFRKSKSTRTRRPLVPTPYLSAAIVHPKSSVERLNAIECSSVLAKKSAALTRRSRVMRSYVTTYSSYPSYCSRYEWYIRVHVCICTYLHSYTYTRRPTCISIAKNRRVIVES